MRVIVAQLGARRHYAVPRALYHSGVLNRMVTDACAEVPPWSWFRQIPTAIRPSFLKRGLGRSIPDIPADIIHGFLWFALSAIWDRRFDLAQTDYWAHRNSQFCKLVVRKGFSDANAVYAFNGAALEIFQTAKNRGLRTYLDQTAAPWRWNTQLLKEESELWPGWEENPAEIDKSGKLSGREEKEWELADRIICGSDFVVSALSELNGPVGKCNVVNYPNPEIGNFLKFPQKHKNRDSFNVLFVGTMQLRKGVQYLMQANKMLKDENVTIRLVGPSLLTKQSINDLHLNMEVVGKVPRSEIVKHYAWADIFVFPTLSEGSANVVLEAMAAGLPVVTTPNAGALIKDGENGILIPIRDFDAIVNAIIKLRDNKEMRERIALAGKQSVLSFQDYAHLLCKSLKHA